MEKFLSYIKRFREIEPQGEIEAYCNEDGHYKIRIKTGEGKNLSGVILSEKDAKDIREAVIFALLLAGFDTEAISSEAPVDNPAPATEDPMPADETPKKRARRKRISDNADEQQPIEDADVSASSDLKADGSEDSSPTAATEEAAHAEVSMSADEATSTEMPKKRTRRKRISDDAEEQQSIENAEVSESSDLKTEGSENSSPAAAEETPAENDPSKEDRDVSDDSAKEKAADDECSKEEDEQKPSTEDTTEDAAGDNGEMTMEKAKATVVTLVPNATASKQIRQMMVGRRLDELTSNMVRLISTSNRGKASQFSDETVRAATFMMMNKAAKD